MGIYLGRKYHDRYLDRPYLFITPKALPHLNGYEKQDCAASSDRMLKKLERKREVWLESRKILANPHIQRTSLGRLGGGGGVSIPRLNTM